ncbi:CDP-glycerol glycerophosphotransferase family protein [Streptomyces sp. NPDC050121]|uniref:bifunctional glycosyltransferase/CDP-glycerol:glycerophosphate glycerophosphotransferase n=1 Tax=Streptomyces sp. NPDC050121 TaxID=3365601 RepID=UPI00379A1FDE
MPRFSVIVPAYRVQAYLHECLESVLSQSYADLELIAVDDRSPDACGEIIDEFAARDTRVRVVHLPRNVGPGQARNAGLAQASGDYLLFLDSDDTLTPDALRTIADRLKETGEPDVLVYDHASTYWTGETVRNPFADQLTEEGPAPFRPADRPGLLNMLMVAWNKAHRREFIEREGLTFPPGDYEDTPWTYPALLAARTLATLDRVCVHHRRRRRGNIPSTTSRGHFDVFEQYDRVFAFVERRPELAQWRPVLFHRMVDHLSTVFTRRDRLPRGSRAEFLRRARAHYRRYRVPGASAPPPLSAPLEWGHPHRSRLRHTVVHFGVHRTYRLLQMSMCVRRRTHKAASKLFRTLRAAVLQAHYRVRLRLPLRADRAVFAAYGGRGHSCNPGALEEAFRTFAPQVRTAWIARPEHQGAVPPGPRQVRPGTATYWTAPDVARLRESRGIPRDTVAVLYAPTHRDYRRVRGSHLDLERVLRRLSPRFMVLSRAHYRQDAPVALRVAGVVDVTGHPSVEALCPASDALITDYSSLMFDYANLDRPIVIHADDWEAYEAARGTYFDLRAFAPGAVARSEDELIDVFSTGHWRGSRSAQLRGAFRERFCAHDDGRAAERVVRRIVLGESELPAVVPLAERRPVPSTARSTAQSAAQPATSVPSARTPLAPVPQPSATGPATGPVIGPVIGPVADGC